MSDNAPAQTQSLIKFFGWDRLDHRPYSPDLAPRDFHLFEYLGDHGSKGTKNQAWATVIPTVAACEYPQIFPAHCGYAANTQHAVGKIKGRQIRSVFYKVKVICTRINTLSNDILSNMAKN
ncbi:hypothetical protein NPIL_229741 [Nephila pilipes]|uniref:Uncharacterized protein n=1 Tax=Nephila pilipes TaxID=299642 RepID=A0A8X6TNI3_NEPPI|nr:hypothetical protein NPIL_229741 [Nephila pilipes]